MISYRVIAISSVVGTFFVWWYVWELIVSLNEFFLCVLVCISIPRLCGYVYAWHCVFYFHYMVFSVDEDGACGCCSVECVSLFCNAYM